MMSRRVCIDPSSLPFALVPLPLRLRVVVFVFRVLLAVALFCLPRVEDLVEPPSLLVVTVSGWVSGTDCGSDCSDSIGISRRVSSVSFRRLTEA